MTGLYITGDRHFGDTLNYCLLRCRIAGRIAPYGEQYEELYQMYSRRNFLKTSATVAAGSLLPSSTLRASIATLAGSVDQPGTIMHTRRLTAGWEVLQGSLGGPWEAWHSEEVAVGQSVALPHSFNAYDGCDPHVPYYRGNGWCRTYGPIANRVSTGPRLLLSHGPGQTT